MNFYKSPGGAISLGKCVKFRDFFKNEEKEAPYPNRKASGKGLT
jgi:hypothetical protein